MGGKLTLTGPRTELDLRIARSVWQWLKTKRVNAALSFDGATVRVSMPFKNATDLGLALDASTAWNIEALKAQPLPPLYSSGVRYAREPLCRSEGGAEHMCEEFVTAHEVYRRGVGDCDDLGPLRAAELRLQGENAQAIARPSAAGWHVVVRRADGSIEDPSAKLGMPTS
jgi:hypothetical protein